MMSSPRVFLKKSGSQMRKNHQTGSVRNLPTMNDHACRCRRIVEPPDGRSGVVSALAGALVGVAGDERALGGRYAPELLGQIVERDPEHEPGEPRAAGDHERRAPAPGERDPGHDGRRHHGADVGARVEERGGERSLPAREPERDGLDRRREVAPLAQPQRDARAQEAGDAADQRVPDRRQAPGRDRQRVADLGPHAVDERAEPQQADRVGGWKAALTRPYSAFVQWNWSSRIGLTSARI